MTEPTILEELAALPTLNFPLVSPDGEQVAFYADFTGRFELYTLNLRTGERRQRTEGQAPSSPRASFVWAARGEALYFSRDHQGDERQAMFELRLDTGQVRALDHQPGSIDYLADVHPDQPLLLVNSTRGGQMNVHLYNLAEAPAWRMLTQEARSTFAVAFSPDGQRVGLNTNRSDDLRNMDGYVLDLNSGALERVFQVREGSQDRVGQWHPDGRQLCVHSDASGHQRVGVLTLDTAQVQWLTPEREGLEEYPGEFSPDGRYLNALRHHEASVVPVVYDLQSGREMVLDLPPGVASGTQFALGGTHLLIQQATTAKRSELLLYDLMTHKIQVVVPADDGGIDPDTFVEAEYVRYPSTGGAEVPALLYRPKGRPQGQRGPALIQIHGGPTAQFFRSFDRNAQFLVSQGYTVLCPNVRGSTGYGVKWRDANLLDWGGKDLEDVAAGAEFLRTLPGVDPARLGVFGASYGGYLSYLAAVKKPELFKVSVPIVGISDLHKLYADNTRDMPQLGDYFKTMMGDPQQNRALWRDRSAITHAAQLKAHMLMMHGANDPRCPINQARDFRDELLRLGRREGEHFEYVEFSDEGHGSADIAGRTRSYRLLADYLARRL